MHNKPLVTIAIPTYNRADSYLRASLQSAVLQDYPNLEILISDNCSTDNTGSVVKEFRHPGIRYVRHESNIGWLENFNYCQNEAAGHFLLLLHDDDLIDSDFVSTCIREAEGNMNVGVIRTGVRIIDGEGNTTREYPNLIKGASNADFFLAWFVGTTPNYLCSTLYNTKGLRESGGFRSKTNLYCDDVALFRTATRFGRIDIGAVKAGYRIHQGNNGSASKISDWCEDSLYLLSLMCELEPERKSEIHGEGMKFFTHANYIRASRIRSAAERYRAYSVIFDRMGRASSYSPLRFLYKRNKARTRRGLSKLYRNVTHRSHHTIKA